MIKYNKEPKRVDLVAPNKAPCHAIVKPFGEKKAYMLTIYDKNMKEKNHYFSNKRDAIALGERILRDLVDNHNCLLSDEV